VPAATVPGMPDMDLTGARRFVETAERPVAGGVWYLLPTEPPSVAYQRPSGEWVYPAQVTAGALVAGVSWREIPAG